MHIEWQGKPELAVSSAPGTFCFFVHRHETHLGIRADDDRRGVRIKGLVSLSTGYLEPPRRPAFFDLSILGTTRVVYTLPDAAFALSTDPKRIHPGRNNMELAPGALMHLGDSLFLCVAYNGNLPFMDLTKGILMKEWPISEHTVWFYAWSVIWRENDSLKTLLDFEIGKQAEPG
jgi:hypothetical protein